MARPLDPLASYRITTHKIGTYVYAATQPSKVDEQTGKRTYRRIHWGRLDPEKKVFTPNMTFLLLPPEERRKFLFPSDWDISAIKRLAGLRSPDRQPQRRHGDRLYGDIWLLEQIADKLGLRQDLRAVFDGNDEMVNMVLTLAMFPYLSKYSYNRLARWQRVVRAPSDETLSAPRITKLTQSITTIHRDMLFRLRAARLGDKPLCAVDSTSRSAYGRTLADVRWGKNKDRSDLPQTNEVVVYSLADHQPFYYRTFPGNMPDCRTFLLVTQELDKAGFKSPVYITDRAYETIRNLESVILKGRALITAAPVNRSLIAKYIKAYGDFAVRPASMTLDRELEIYHEQFEERYVVGTAGKTEKTADRLRVHLFFDPELRAKQVKALDLETGRQEELLAELRDCAETIEDADALREDCNLFKLTIEDRKLTDFAVREKKLERRRCSYGFFSLLTHGLDDDSVSALMKYRLRDEQEKYFEHMKQQMGFDMQNNWSEEGKTGRLFILFVGLILASHVRHIWRTTALRERFDSSLAVLDEMRCIRAIETPGAINQDAK